MADDRGRGHEAPNMTSFHGTGFQQSGSGSVHVGGDLKIGATNGDDRLARLQATNPRHDKKRIEDAKGGLLAGSYEWILRQQDFVQWRNHDSTRVLLIKGDAGKGKTMLLCGAINELTKGPLQGHATAYFFCEATDSRTNNSESILRGLIHMLVEQRPELDTHLPSRPVPDDCNTWFALSEMFLNILEDSRIEHVVLFIDALNECDENQTYPRILDTICQTTDNPRVKWLLTSRHNDEIEENLTEAASQSTLCLELKDNAVEVARAVRHYIKESLTAVRALQGDEQLSSNVRGMMEEKSQDTFLWVSLVVQELKLLRPRHKNRALAIVEQTPRGLHSLYERMSRKIEDLESDDSSLCRNVLLRMLTAFRPLQLVELGIMIQHSPDNTAEVVRLCGSFLTVPDEALPLSKQSVYVVHHSAQTYLREASFLDFQGCSPTMDRSLFVEAVTSMEKSLKQDFYDLNNPGTSIADFNLTRPEPDPLAGLRYYCEYWIQHFGRIPGLRSAVSSEASDEARVELFLTKHLLFWVEAMSYLEILPQGLEGLRALTMSLEVNMGSDCRPVELADDATSYLVKHLAMIQEYPLQTYAAGLILSPKTSMTRQNFSTLSPNWVSLAFGQEESWATNMTAVQATEDVRFMAFSGNDKFLACIASKYSPFSSRPYLQIWNVETGHLSHQRIFEERITGMDISYDGSFVILFSSWQWCYYPVITSCHFAGWQSVVPLFDPTAQLYYRPFPDSRNMYHGPSEAEYWMNRSYKLSPDLSLLATCHATEPRNVCLITTENAQIYKTLDVSGSPVSFGFSNRGKWFAAATSLKRKGLVKIWDLGTSSTIVEITTAPNLGRMFTFPETTYLMLVSFEKTTDHIYEMWDASTSTSLWAKALAADHDPDQNVFLSPDCNFVVFLGSSTSGCFIVDAHNGSFLSKISLPTPWNLEPFRTSWTIDGCLLAPFRSFVDEEQLLEDPLEKTWLINPRSGQVNRFPHQSALGKSGIDRWAVARPHRIIEILDGKDIFKEVNPHKLTRQDGLRLCLDGQLQTTTYEESQYNIDSIETTMTPINRAVDGSYVMPVPSDKLPWTTIHNHAKKPAMGHTASSLLHRGRMCAPDITAYSSDGSILTFQSWNQSDPFEPQYPLTLWDARTGRPIGSLASPPSRSGDVRPVPLSAPGNRIAVTDTANTIYLWDHDLGQWILRLPTKLKSPIELVVIDWTTVRFVSHHEVFTRPIPVQGTKPKPSKVYGIDCSGEWLTRDGKREIKLPLTGLAQSTRPADEKDCQASQRGVAVVPGTIATTSYTYCPIVFNIHND